MLLRTISERIFLFILWHIAIHNDFIQSFDFNRNRCLSSMSRFKSTFREIKQTGEKKQLKNSLSFSH